MADMLQETTPDYVRFLADSDDGEKWMVTRTSQPQVTYILPAGAEEARHFKESAEASDLEIVIL